MWPLGHQRTRQRVLAATVDLGHLAAVGLEVGAELAGLVGRQGDAVGQIGETQRERQLGGQVDVEVGAAHRGNSGCRFSRSAARPSAASAPRKLSIS